MSDAVHTGGATATPPAYPQGGGTIHPGTRTPRVVGCGVGAAGGQHPGFHRVRYDHPVSAIRRPNDHDGRAGDRVRVGPAGQPTRACAAERVPAAAEPAGPRQHRLELAVGVRVRVPLPLLPVGLFVATLWLLSAWWRGELRFARYHVRVLGAVLLTVLAGLVIAPGSAFSGPDGRLSGVIWPIPATQVGQYCAVAAGLAILLWLTRSIDGRSARPSSRCRRSASCCSATPTPR